MRELRAAGATFPAIVAQLRAEGVASRAGKPLALSAVHALAQLRA